MSLTDKLELQPIIRIACDCGHDWYTRRERWTYWLKQRVPYWLRRTWLSHWYHQREDLERAEREAVEVMKLFRNPSE